MTTRNLQTRILLEGGWSTDFGPSAPVTVGQDGVVRIPYLVNAENVVFDLDGGPKEVGGTERLFLTALNSGATVRGLFDFWVQGTGPSAAQHRVVHVGNELMADSGDNVFASILGAQAARDTSSIPSYAVFDDDLIIMSNVSGEVPLRWTGSGNVSVLGTNTPDCAFGVTHKNRFWMAGNQGAKSRLYYSEPLPNGANGNWNEVEAGFIDIDPDDGDAITGLVSHKKQLWVFKGPNKGSIHRISGDTPLAGVSAYATSIQPVPFQRENFVRGLGAAGHNSIFRFRDDIGFIDGKTSSVRSLNATDQFGDFREASLSFPINDYLFERVNKAQLKAAWAVNDVSNGRVVIALPIDASTDNNILLSMDYRFESPRWSSWPAIQAQCVAAVIDPGQTNREGIFIGDTDGFVRRTNGPNANIDGLSAINYKVTLPFIDYGTPIAMKTLARASVGIAPAGEFNATFSWTRDNFAKQSATFSQGGGDVLGGTGDSGSFTGVADSGGGIISLTAAGHSVSAGNTLTISGSTFYDGVYTVAGVIGAFILLTTTFLGNDSGTYTASNVVNYFVLGTSTLSGSRYVDRFMSLEEGGEFRSIQYELTQTGINEGLEVHSLFTEIELGADSVEN